MRTVGRSAAPQEASRLQGPAGMRGSGLPAVVVLWALALVPAPARAGPLLEGFLGTSQSAAGTLAVVQAGVASTQAAVWSSASFASPPYWAVRAGWGLPSMELTLELVHHKLFLRSPVAPVERFAVSHGFNLVLAAAAARLGPSMLARAGVGVVVAHPESQVGGLAWGGGPLDGFVVAGPVAALGVERRWRFTRWWGAALELAFSLAWAQVPVALGHARLVDAAAHLRLGLFVGR